MIRMKEPEKHIAVAHRAAQADFTRSLQRFGEREGFQAVSVIRHKIRVTPVAAEDKAAQFSLRLSTSEARGAVTKVKARAHIRRRVSTAVLEFVPARITVESFRLAIDRYIVEPDFSAAISGFHHVEQPEAIDRRAIGLVPGVEMTDGGLVVHRDDDAAAAPLLAGS